MDPQGGRAQACLQTAHPFRDECSLERPEAGGRGETLGEGPGTATVPVAESPLNGGLPVANEAQPIFFGI